jgi:hypothetical protein
MKRRMIMSFSCFVIAFAVLATKGHANTVPPDQCGGQHGTMCFVGGCPGDKLDFCNNILGCPANNAICVTDVGMLLI